MASRQALASMAGQRQAARMMSWSSFLQLHRSIASGTESPLPGSAPTIRPGQRLRKHLVLLQDPGANGTMVSLPTERSG